MRPRKKIHEEAKKNADALFKDLQKRVKEVAGDIKRYVQIDADLVSYNVLNDWHYNLTGKTLTRPKPNEIIQDTLNTGLAISRPETKKEQSTQ